MAVLKNLLQIDGVDARSLAEIKRRHAQECTSLHILGLPVCKQTGYCFEPRTSMSVLIQDDTQMRRIFAKEVCCDCPEDMHDDTKS